MSGSAAEKIVIDDEVLLGQERSLRAHAQTLATTVGPAKARISGTAFGAMNAFLVGPMNDMASRTAELAQESAEMASRMSAGVAAARGLFAAREEDAAAAFEKFEVEA